MKTRFSLFFVAMLLLVSCSQEETVTELNNQEVSLKGENPDNRRFRCNPHYLFPVYNPFIDHLHNLEWTITYDSRIVEEDEITCIRQEYFSQSALNLKLCIDQPADPYVECWRLMPGWPSQTTSTTIDDDPRLTANNNSGG